MMDASLLLEWLKSDDATIQLEALEQLCTMILFSDNVDRLFENLSPRLFIPALASIFVKFKNKDDVKKAREEKEQGQEQKTNPSNSNAMSDLDADQLLIAKMVEESEQSQTKFKVLETAARALTNFFDASSTCSKRLVQVQGSLSAMSHYILHCDLTEMLQKDLAEQLVKAFEFISSREPDELYKAGALRAILKLIKNGRGDGGRSKLFTDTVTSAMNIVNRLVTKFRPEGNSANSANSDNEDIELLADLALHNNNKNTSFACLKCVNSILSQLARNGKELPNKLTDVSSKDSDLAKELLQFVIIQLKNSVNDDENDNNESFSSMKSPIKHLESSSGNLANNSTNAGPPGSSGHQLSCTIIATLVNLTYTLLTQCKSPSDNLEFAIETLELSAAIESILLYHRDNRAKQDIALLLNRLIEFFSTPADAAKSFKLQHLRVAQVHQKTQKDLIDTIKSKDVDGLIDAYDGGDITLDQELGEMIFFWCCSFGSPEMVEFIAQTDYDYLTERIKSQGIHHALNLQREDILEVLLAQEPDLNYKMDNTKYSIVQMLEAENYKAKSPRIYKMFKDYLNSIGSTAVLSPQNSQESSTKSTKKAETQSTSSTTGANEIDPKNRKMCSQLSAEILLTLIKVTEDTPEQKNQLVFLQALEKILSILDADQILNLKNTTSRNLADKSLSSSNLMKDETPNSENHGNHFLNSLAEILNKCMSLEEEDFKTLLKIAGKGGPGAGKSRSKNASERKSISQDVSQNEEGQSRDDKAKDVAVESKKNESQVDGEKTLGLVVELHEVFK